MFLYFLTRLSTVVKEIPSVQVMSIENALSILTENLVLGKFFLSSFLMILAVSFKEYSLISPSFLDSVFLL